MVKMISFPIDDDLYAEVVAVKGKKTWVEFMKDIVQKAGEKHD